MVSIIVATGNTNKLLQKCLDSILAQNYRDYEIILIDNSMYNIATDVCQKYVGAYPHIIKSQIGPTNNATAKNTGLNIAKGDYIFFLSGNDYISENTLSDMVTAIEKSNAEICICGAKIESATETSKYIDIENEIITKSDLLKKLTNPQYFLYTSIDNKLYKKSLFDNLRFEEINKFSCEAITHRIFEHCQKAVCLKEKYYTTGMPYNFEYEKFHCNENIDIALIYYERYRFLKKSHKQSATECLKFGYHFLVNTLKNNSKQIQVYGYEKKYKKIITRYVLSFGVNPRGLKLLKTYNKAKCAEKKEIKSWIKKLKAQISNIRKKHANIVFMLATPTHGNLGDQAIVYAEKYFITQNGYSSEQIIEISNDDYLKYHEQLKKIVEPQDLIVIDGGGNMGTLWPWEDEKITKIIEEYANNAIRIFPQTIYYDNTDFAREMLCKNQEVYQKAKNLHILLRDKRSFDFAIEKFKNVKFTFTPDIVLCIDNLATNHTKSGVLICFREDLEKNIDDAKISEIETYFTSNSIDCKKTSTLVDHDVTQDTRDEVLSKKWVEFSSAKLVVTDRLHAMIFAAITGTPCIAFDNLSKKVSGVYEWINELPYIKCVEKNTDIFESALTLYNIEPSSYTLSDKVKKSFSDFLS